MLFLSVAKSHHPIYRVCRETLRLSLMWVLTLGFEQIRLVEGRDRPIDRLAKNVLLFGQQDEGEVDVSAGKMLAPVRYRALYHDHVSFSPQIAREASAFPWLAFT